MHLTELKLKPISELVELAESMGLENMARLRKQDIIFAILKSHAKNGEEIFDDCLYKEVKENGILLGCPVINESLAECLEEP